MLDWLLITLWRPWPYDELRQTFLAQVFLIFYAAHGVVMVVHIVFKWLSSLPGKMPLLRWQYWAAAALALVITMNAVPKSAAFVADSSHVPDFAIPQQIGTWLASRLQPNDAIWVLSDDVFPAYAIATYTGRPFAGILDHRLDAQSIESSVRSANHVYILELFKTRSALSDDDERILGALESGQISAQVLTIAGTKIWITSGSQIGALSPLHNSRATVSDPDSIPPRIPISFHQNMILFFLDL